MTKKAFAYPQKPLFVNIKRSETEKKKIIFGKEEIKLYKIFLMYIY